MEIIGKKFQDKQQRGQTMVEYVLLMAVMAIVIMLTFEQMRKPITGFLTTMSQGFQSVVRYGDRRIRADRAFENEHPGNPSRVIPRHF